MAGASHRVHYRPDRQAIAKGGRPFEDGVEFLPGKRGLEEEQCQGKGLVGPGRAGRGREIALTGSTVPLLGYGLLVVNLFAALLLIPALLALGAACYEEYIPIPAMDAWV